MLNHQGHELLAEIDAPMQAAYEAHMKRLKITPLEPLGFMHGLTGTDSFADASLVLGPALDDKIKRLEAANIDIRSILSASFIVGTLTEDNLPYYSIENAALAANNEVMDTWLHEWITQEDAHGVLLRDYGIASGLLGKVVAPKVYEVGRISQLRAGMDIEISAPAQAFSYLSLQERATAISHQNFGWLVDDTYGRRMMNAITGDESRHHNFYTTLTNALLEVDPDTTVVAIRDTFRNFAMPGERGIPDFKRLSQAMGIAGMLDPKQLIEAEAKLVGDYAIEERTFTSEEAKQAQEELVTGFTPDNPAVADEISQLDRVRERLIQRADRKGQPRPLILNHSVMWQRVDGHQQLVAA